MLSYSANSAVSLAAGGGDIRIGNRPADSLTLDPNQQGTVDDCVTTDTTAAILPPKVDFTAFNGNILYTGLYTRPRCRRAWSPSPRPAAASASWPRAASRA